MKLSAIILLLAACFAVPVHAARAPEYISDGVPNTNNTTTLHLSGVAVKVRVISVYDHVIGCTPITGCAQGPLLTFWIQSGAQASNCSQWYTKIRSLEHLNPATSPYSYLELVNINGGLLLTDEGIYMYPLGTLVCNGALDWNPPAK